MMGRTGRNLLKVSCVAACLLVSGCIVEDRPLNTKSGGVSGTGGSSTTGGQCSMVGEGPCLDCVRGACDGSCVACQNNQQCLDLAQCLNACGDEYCTSTCVQIYPGGMDILNALGECVQAWCSVECGYIISG